jgi:MFS family permease
MTIIIVQSAFADDLVLRQQVCGMSEVDSYGGMLAYRFFLGLIEAGFLPGVLYIMTCWYKRSEIGRCEARRYSITTTDFHSGKRFSIFFTALCFSGAASGLLSGAIISGLEGAKGLAGWRW